jgi:hypothetical protein
VIRRALGLALVIVVSTLVPHDLAAQGFRVRLDARAQSVGYRGIAADSIPVADTVRGPNGGPQTADGFAVSCRSGLGYCVFFRPGSERRAAPMVVTAEATVWGLGVRGLSLHAMGRLAADLGAADVWPGPTPTLQLLEGFAQYAATAVTARLGRQYIASRLGFEGWDGAQLTLRHLESGLEITAYGGFGLARGMALPVTSPALNPLDDFQPRERQLLAGAQAGLARHPVALRAVYQRAFDPRLNYLVAERGGLDATLSLPFGLSLSGGADYDFAAGDWGSTEGVLAFAPSHAPVSVAAGARRYRPHFDLWTIWGAFSPVPYHAVHGSVALGPVRGVRVRARGEQYWFDPTEAETPLVAEAMTHGWRWNAGATYQATAALAIDLGYHLELGPGAGSGGFAGSVRYAPTERLSVSAHGAYLERPLEFRFSDATLRSLGIASEYRPSPRLLLGLDLIRHNETRDRPDAAAFDWNQLRLSARATVLFGSDPDGPGLPPAVRQMPQRSRLN